MKCPLCDVDLLLAERQGVEIDYCPKCRGVWLDRGELDILIERANALGYPAAVERRESRAFYGLKFSRPVAGAGSNPHIKMRTRGRTFADG